MMELLEVIPPELIRLALALAVLAAFVGANALLLVYIERKTAGFVQRRPGPYEVGPRGILTPVADAFKLMGKQSLIPDCADRPLFRLAPLLAFAPLLLMMMPMEFGPNLYGLSLNMGLLLILAFAGVNVLAVCLAGWSSNNKWSLLGAARAVAQSVAYEIPVLLCVLAVLFMTGSLDMLEIGAGQGPWPWQWNVVMQPLAFILFFICSLAESHRAPFDLPEAESELTAGFHTEYSGMPFAIFFLAEYTEMTILCAVAVILFLGGWQGPFMPGPWWFLIKLYALLLIMIWIRWTFPRVRFDIMLSLCWRYFIPLALLNLFITAVVLALVR